MRAKQIVVLGVSLFILAGCATPPLWNKPGASEQDFNADKYQCMQGSQQQTSSVYIGPYGGSGSSGQTTNTPLFTACMQAKGWSLQRQNAEAQAASNSVMETGRKNCATLKYAPYYSKTACLATEITFEQQADTSKISPAAQAIFLELRGAIDANSRQDWDNVRKNGGSLGAKRMDLYYSTAKVQNDKNNLDLYNGTITWGEYNKRRQAIASDFAEAQRKLTP